MSVDATRWAWMQSGIKATDKLVLLALADRADESHRCWPGVARMSKDTCLDRKTVMASICRLEASGLVSCKRHHGVGTVYTLNGVTGREASTENGTSPKSGTSTESGTGPVPKTVLPPVPKTGHKPKREPKREPNKGKPASVPAFHQAVIDAYHECLPGLPAVRVWNTKRQRVLDRARKEYPKCDDLAWWGRYFDHVAGSPFLMGENDRNWTPDLEWLCDVTRLTKVIEGKYHQKGAA